MSRVVSETPCGAREWVVIDTMNRHPCGMAISQYGAVIACSSLNGNDWDGEVRLFSLSDTSTHLTFTGSRTLPYPVSSVCWVAPDCVAIGTATGDVLVAHTSSLTPPLPGEEERKVGSDVVLEGHLGGVTAVAQEQGKGGRVVSGAADGVVRIWDVKRQISTHVLPMGAPVDDVAWLSPDTFAAVSACPGGSLRLFDLRMSTNEHAWAVESDEFRAVSDSGDSHSVYCGSEAGCLMKYDLRGSTLPLLSLAVTKGSAVTSVARTGSSVACGSGHGHVALAVDVWEVVGEGESTAPPSIAKTWTAHRDSVSCVGWLPGAKPTLVSAAWDRTLIAY